jgi:hypothetical protein
MLDFTTSEAYGSRPVADRGPQEMSLTMQRKYWINAQSLNGATPFVCPAHEGGSF